MTADASQIAALGSQAARAASGVHKDLRAVEGAVARRIADSMRDRAPVATGELRGSIRVVDSTVEAAAEHAAYVEYGTARTDPQPYMNPAADQHTEQFYRDAEDAAADAVERALR
jgi:HK97 gp10 family phage protein